MLASCLSSDLKHIKSIIMNYYCKHISEASLVGRKIHDILNKKINLMFFKFVFLIFSFSHKKLVETFKECSLPCYNMQCFESY